MPMFKMFRILGLSPAYLNEWQPFARQVLTLS